MRDTATHRVPGAPSSGNKLVWICLGLFLLSWTIFLIGVQFPRGLNFDEFHYVPSAKQFLALQENRNWEHPPLGKELMAIGIKLGGDRPFGWRVMSTLFGALTFVGMYLWALALFRDRRNAAWVALITLFNHLLYVQARIGMLDTFMFGFMVWGLATFTMAWDPDVEKDRAIRLLRFSGLMFGLATACKWFGVLAWATALGLLVIAKFASPPRPQLKEKERIRVRERDHWLTPGLFERVELTQIALAFVLIPLFAYASTFIPFFFIERTPPYTLLDILKAQPRMWSGQLSVVTHHPYDSKWYGWPFLVRPIWYAFDKEGPGGEWVRGVLLLGNPMIMWTGVMAVLTCGWEWFKHRSRVTFFIFAWYCALYLPWAIIPRKINFYYYYYPAGMILSLAVCKVFDLTEQEAGTPGRGKGRWIFAGLVVGTFIYFFPILAALKIPSHLFRMWMWSGSWI